MLVDANSWNENYWHDFSLLSEDIDSLYQYLIDLERPAYRAELLSFVVQQRLEREIEQIKKHRANLGSVYRPREHYHVGDLLRFPAHGGKHGKVVNVRNGYNPNFNEFEVIQIEFSSGETKEFAAGFEHHPLNDQIFEEQIPLSVEVVLQNCGDLLLHRLEETLSKNSDFIYNAGRWFLKSLILDLNPGYLNLAEALLDMADGGPLSTHTIIEQIGIASYSELLEFSFDVLLKQDPRFDDVGPAGEVWWFLHRMEPESVQKTPLYLNVLIPPTPDLPLPVEMHNLEMELGDELSESDNLPSEFSDQAKVQLIYPHWRSGTLPLTPQISKIFPTAYESPRVRFVLVDAEDGKKFPGWVVRPGKYVDGIGKWYQYRGLIPGSIFYVKRGSTLGEVLLSANSRKPSREWMCTVLMGSDNKPVFSMLKQPVRSEYDDLLTFVVPEAERLDHIWLQGGKGQPAFEKMVLGIARDLSKLNPQGNVHAKQLYAAANLFKRCSPRIVFKILLSSNSFTHVGDLYFRLQVDDNSSM